MKGGVLQEGYSKVCGPEAAGMKGMLFLLPILMIIIFILTNIIILTSILSLSLGRKSGKTYTIISSLSSSSPSSSSSFLSLH